jgi:hypothetical protein
MPIFRDHFMRRHHGLCLLKLGYVHQAMRDYPTAAGYLTDSMAIFGQLELIRESRTVHYDVSGSSQLSGRT